MKTVQFSLVAKRAQVLGLILTFAMIGCSGSHVTPDGGIDTGDSDIDARPDTDEPDVGPEPDADPEPDVGPEPDADPEPDVGPEPDAGPAPDGPMVDVLIVVDASRGMMEEQRRLADVIDFLPQHFYALGIRGQVGVVTSDLGVFGVALPTCSDMGDDGVLSTRCGGDPLIKMDPRGDLEDLDRVAERLSCRATPGAEACGFEQPLEAMLKAVARTDSDLRFHPMDLGHGDGANEGVLRRDAKLLVLMLTDEDDCSAADPGLFDPRNPVYDGPLNARCAVHEHALYPMSRYVNGLIEARGNARDIVFAAIAGLPVDLEGSDYDEVLRDRRMEIRVDDRLGTIQLSCLTSDGGAAPPRRLVRFARALERAGGQSMVMSSCADDYLDAVAEAVIAVAPE